MAESEISRAGTGLRDSGQTGERGLFTPDDSKLGDATNGFWADAEWLWCRDDKYRPVPRATESELEQMADGTAGDLGLVRLARRAFSEVEGEEVIVYAPLVTGGKARVRRLKGYGNAICAPVAQAFIEAWLEAAG
jgi:DNA (cytosine-5)-methyltransferase 1